MSSAPTTQPRVMPNPAANRHSSCQQSVISTAGSSTSHNFSLSEVVSATTNNNAQGSLLQTSIFLPGTAVFSSEEQRDSSPIYDEAVNNNHQVPKFTSIPPAKFK